MPKGLSTDAVVTGVVISVIGFAVWEFAAKPFLASLMKGNGDGSGA